MRARLTAGAFWLALALVWWWFAGGSVRAHFSTDDTNNLYRYWQMGWAGLLQANLLFFSDGYRPAGGVLYLAVYSLFGFQIAAFRAVCLSLVLLNIGVLYFTAREVTGDRYTAAAATVLGSIHPALMLIWYSNGTLFDSLCYLFFCSTLLAYLRGAYAALVLILFAGALNSKEMAVTLPLVCAAHDWFASTRRLRLLSAMFTMSVAFAVGKAISPLAASTAYHPVFTASRYLETSRSLLAAIFQMPFSDAMLICAYLLMTVHVLFVRSRALTVAAVLAIFGFLPLNFITPREPFVVYLPLAGWAMYVALTLSQLRLRGVWIVSAAFGVAVTLNAAYLSRQGDPIGATMPMRRLVESFRKVDPKPAPGSCVLLTGDPFYPDWDTYFLAKLYFRDPSVRVRFSPPDAALRGEECSPIDTTVR
ncbi:MAG: glycosyltransferase family 39 protein, partial [Bryobacterales bacterium]|nr:glycosyltransferase family 39 protein [Bryobacterales bacterium]